MSWIGEEEKKGLLSGKNQFDSDSEAHHEVSLKDSHADKDDAPVDEKVDAFKICILIAISLMTFGSYWVFDIPGSIQTQLTAWFGGPTEYTDSMNGWLYSIYSYPNVILAFFGGFLVDRIGNRPASMLFCGLVLAGQVLFSMGVQLRHYWLCIVGRFVFGLGGESLTVVQNTYTARWFQGKNIAVFFGIVVSISRIGSSINFAVTPRLTDYGVPASVWAGTGMCVISMVASLVAAALDWYGRNRVKDVSADEKISLTHAKTFPLAAWVIFLICVFFYVAVFTFYTVASVIMQSTGLHWPRYDPTQATFFLFIPNFVSIFASPLFGYLVDKKGFSLLWLFEASCMLCLAHVAFLFNANNVFWIPPIPVFIWLGIAYSLGCAALWPMVSYIIPEQGRGTAYGIMTSMQNAGLAIFPNIINAIQDRTVQPLSSTIPLIIFMLCALVASGLILVLFSIDAVKHKGVLNAPASERPQLQKELGIIDGSIN